ncbi:MAG: DUF3782 domain-containing protein [Desulfamplus sp.]
MEQALTLDAHSFFKEVREMQKETERRFQETERRFQETDRLIGRLGSRLGDFVEEMVRPGAVRLFRERGINVHVVSRNVTAEREGEAVEIDLLVVNDGEMIAVECKSSLSIDDVNEHLERLGRVKKLFPHYREMKVMGAVAAMVIPENVGKYAYKKGLFVLFQSGDTMVIRNDDKFEPKLW